MTNFDLFHYPTPDALAEAAAKTWLEELAAHGRSRYCVALSGGRITQTFFSATVRLAGGRQGMFDAVQFFWADERCVGPADKESNYRIALELLFAPLGIADGQIHRIRGEDAPPIAAAQAELEICTLLPANEERQPVLDLIFLGMGEDGHVASLFPEESAEGRANPAVYRNVVGAKPPPNRVTLGYPALAAARQVWMLGSGAGKEAALRESLSPSGQTPFARVLQLRQRTKIFTDINL
jgi:6-phosphogluconolactonase